MPIPILFSAPMVRAILDGRKTQTRRVLKPQPDRVIGGYPAFDDMGDLVDYPIKYRKGDQLWVRETWRPIGHNFPIGHHFEYRATAEQDLTPTDGLWKPSIFMPRAASRITLEITSIRVERLQDVSESDSIAEGVESWVEDRWKSQPTHYKIYHREPGDESSYSSTAKFSYETLWQSINGPKSWDENPWVWVIEFKKIQPHANQ